MEVGKYTYGHNKKGGIEHIRLLGGEYKILFNCKKL